MTNIKDLLQPHPQCAALLERVSAVAARRDQEVYVVGGFVRDLFLQRPLKEIDLMVVGDGIEFAQALADELGVKKIIPFPKFSTAKIPYKPLAVEVAAARTETYQPDSRKPATVRYTDLKGDLLRRDFTINAMAMDVRPDSFGNLHDPHGGIADLQKQLLVTPLNPEETFAEDPLRMLRAAYFASELSFTLSPGCLTAMVHQAHRITIVSQERVTAEFTKILQTSKPSIGLLILQESGLMQYVFPEIHAMYGLEQTPEWHHKDIFAHTLQVVDNAARLSDKMKIRFAALVHDIAKPRTRRIDQRRGYTFYGHDYVGSKMLDQIARRMKLPNELRDYLKKMTELHLRPIVLAKEGVTDSAIRRLMVAAGDEIDDLMTLCRADITSKNPRLVQQYMGNFERVERKMQDVQERDAMQAFQSPVRGDVIMKVCGIGEGKLVGKIKSAIEEAILGGEIENTYEAAYEYLLTIKDQFLQNHTSPPKSIK